MKGYATWKVRKVFLCVYDSTTSSEKEDLLFFFFFRPKQRKENIYTRILIASLRRSYFSNLFQAFEISQSVRARPRENSSECKYSSRIRILIKDNSIESRKGRQQRTTAPRFFLRWHFPRLLRRRSSSIHFQRSSSQRCPRSPIHQNRHVKEFAQAFFSFFFSPSLPTSREPIAKPKLRGKAKKRVGGAGEGRVAGEKEGKGKKEKEKREKERKEERKRERKGKKRKKGERGEREGRESRERAGRGQKDSSEIKNGQAAGRGRVAIL